MEEEEKKEIQKAINEIQKAIDNIKNRRQTPHIDRIFIGSKLFEALEKNNLIETRQPSAIDKKYNIKIEKEGIWKRK